MVSSEGLLWYIFNGFRCVEISGLKLFPPAKIGQDDRREVVLALSVQKYHLTEEFSTGYFFEREMSYLKTSATSVNG